MMLTRCPACQTVFRLRPEQLHARRGEVRCGHCFHPFNAIEHALALPADEPPVAPPPVPEFLILEDKPAPPLARPSPASMLDFGIPEPEPAPEPEPQPGRAFPDQPYAGRWPMDEDAVRHPITEPATDHKRASASTPTAGPEPHPFATTSTTAASVTIESALSEPADTALPRAFPGVLRSGRRPPPLAEPPLAEPPLAEPPLTPLDEAIASPAASTDQTLPPVPPDSARATHHPASDAAAQAPDGADPGPDLARLDATYGRPPRRAHRVVRALGAMLVLALTALLGAQTAYLYRMEIARELPGLRPLLTEACARAGCTIPYPQDAERIAIEASDLQAEPGKPGRYLLHATLNNRAEYPQRWPHLELTLTDAGDTPMSRRVLAPADWLSAAETTEAFPARNAVELRLPFEVAGLAPTGYRIYAFYP